VEIVTRAGTTIKRTMARGVERPTTLPKSLASREV